MEQPTSASGNGSTYTNQRIRREEGWGVPTSRVAAPLCPHQPAEDSACRRRRRRPWKALRASPLGPAAADGSESSVADLARLNGRTSTRALDLRSRVGDAADPYNTVERTLDLGQRAHPRRLTRQREPRRLIGGVLFL